MTREEAIELANDMAFMACIWIDDEGNEVNDLVKLIQSAYAAGAAAEQEKWKEIVEGQRQRLQALNEIIGGEDSTTTGNILSYSRWEMRLEDAIAAEREHYDKLFEQIKGWCEAYPISVFPEPDFKKAHEVLKANGMTLDSISASNMKHVITQVQKMIDDAIRARGQQ